MINQNIIKIVIFLLIFDGIWLGIISRNFYQQAIQAVTGQTDNAVRTYSIPIVYVLLVAGIYLFVLPRVDQADLLRSSIFWGGLFGFITYAIFDFTNHAIFPGWDLKTSVIDTMWGTFLSASVTYLTLRFNLPMIN